MPSHTGFPIRRMRDDERQVGHMMLEVAARVLAVPNQVLHLVEGVLRGQVLPEKLGGGEKRVAVPGWGGGDGGEVLEARDLGDGLLDTGVLIDFFLKEEEAVVMHGHGFGAGHGAGLGVFGAGVFDCLSEAKGPRCRFAGGVGLAFKDLDFGGVLEAAQYYGRAGFRESAYFLHVDVLERILHGLVSRCDDDAGWVYVVEVQLHAWPVEEWRSLSEVRRTAIFVDQVVRHGRDSGGVAHCDGTINRSDERTVPRSGKATNLWNKRHGKLGGLCGRMNG